MMAVATILGTTLFGFFGLGFLQACGEKTEVETVKPMMTIPAPSAPKVFEPPMPSVSTLGNGTSVWLLENHELPVVVFSIVLPGGGVADPEGKWGQATLANQMLTEAAGSRSATEISTYLYGLAVDVEVETTRKHTIIQVAAHKDRLQAALSVVADMIFAPKFAESDWERVKEQHLAGVQQNRQDAGWVASHYAPYFLYGATHPLGKSSVGTPKSVEAIKLKDVKAWHYGRLKGAQGKLGVVAVGDIAAAEVEQLVELHFSKFPSLERADIVAPSIVDQAIQATPRTVLVDMPGSEQTSIRVLAPSYESGDEREIAADLAGIVMGGTFTSRLNAKLREEKGYTYGAGCSFSTGYYGSHLSVRTSVQSKATAEAIQDMQVVLATAKEGFSLDDQSKAVSAYRGDFIQMSGSRKQLASEMVELFRLGEDAGVWTKELSASQVVTTEQMQATAELFDANRGVMVLVGDAKTVRPQLDAAGISYEMVNMPE